MADTLIDTLSIKIEGDSNSAEKSIDRVVSKLDKLKSGAKGSTNSVNSFSNKIGSLKSSINSIKSDSLKNISSSVKSYGGTTQATISTDSTARATSLSNTISEIKSKAQITDSSFSNWKKSLSSAGSRLSSVVSSLSTVYSTAKRVAYTFASLAKEGFSKLISAVKSVGSSIKKAFSSSVIGKFGSKIKNLISSLKRIAFYRFIRSVIKNITEAFKTGIDNMYQYSKAFNGEYAKSLDTLASANLTFKNSIGAMMAPLINTVVPLLDRFLTQLTEINNKIAEIFAGLAGKKTFSKAVRVSTEYAEAADNASKNTEKLKDKTEELKRSFAGLDEITVIGDQAADSISNTSSITNANANTPDYSSMFVEAPVQLSALSKELFDSLKSIDWSGLGSFFAEKINGLLDKIDWSTIKKKAEETATRIFTFINGFVADSDWTLLGKTIANGIQAALIYLITLYEGINWSAIGVAVGKIINEIVTPENAKLMARAIISLFSAGLSLAIGLITTINWQQFSDSIIEFITNFDLAKVMEGATNLVNAFADALRETDFKAIGEAFRDKINEVEWKDVWEGVVNLFVEIMQGAFDLLGFDIDTSNLKDSLNEIAQPFAKLFGELKSSVGEVLKPVVEKTLPAAVKLLGNIARAIKPIISAATPFLTWFSSESARMFESLNPIILSLGDAFSSLITMLTPLLEFFIELHDEIAIQTAPMLADIFSILKELFEFAAPYIQIIVSALQPIIPIIKQIFSLLSGSLQFISGVISGDWSKAWEGLKKPVETALGNLEELWNGIVGFFNTSWNVVTEKFDKAKEYFGGIWSGIKDAFSGASDWFESTFSDGADNAKDAFSGIGGWFGDRWSDIKDAFPKVGAWFKEKFEYAVIGIKTAFLGIKNWFKELWEGIKTVIKTPINGIIDFMNILIDGINSISIDLPDWLEKLTGYSSFGFHIEPIEPLATGGFPEDGLFFANHNELVGQFSNGRTAVANNEQIVEGIAEGVESANEETNKLLREQNNYLRALLAKESTISVSSITNAFVRQNQRNGMATVAIGTT